MATDKVKRKLTAILSADVKGYSRLMGEDEEWTLRTLNAYKEVMRSLVQQHRGRVVSTPGDNVLADFASVVDAVQCAVESQQVLRAKNAMLPENRRVQFRIGINLGDVIEEEDSIYGDGVNIAARLEGLAEAGGICISGSAYEQIENKLPLRYDYLGEHEVKNIAKPVRVYRARIEAEAAPSRPPVEAASREKMAFPIPDKPSIAVLPFLNMSDDPHQEYFSDGMTEDLITDLSKISGLFVIARNSTFTYKGKPVKVKQVAEELGVRYVLEGSVRRAGEQVRINAQLIDATTGYHLWAERYDGNMRDVFAMQDQITQNIISALAVKLTGTEKQTVADKGTDNLEAYDAFLRGSVCLSLWKPDDLARAVQYFKKAIELDPNYGQAYAALAFSYYWVGTQFAMSKGLGVSYIESRLRGVQYLKQAMKNPTSMAHQLNAAVYLLRRQHDEAVSESKRALALAPNFSLSNVRMGHALYFTGKPKEAIDYINRSIRLDPIAVPTYTYHLGMAQFCMGNLEEATTSFEKACRLGRWDHNGWLACMYALLGREKEARLAMDTLRINLKKEFELEPFAPRIHMYRFPFKDRAVADRFVEGMIKAGFPGKPSGYFPAFKENQLNAEEIKRFLFGSKITGIDQDGRQWWIESKKNGEFSWRGGGPISSDTGKSRIEGDMMYVQYDKRLWGIEYCQTVFRNPGGTYEGKDEYFYCSDIGFSPFSLMK